MYNPLYSEFISALEYELRENGYNIILSGSTKDQDNLSNLLSWNVDELGGYLATKYLLQKGHRNSGIISGTIKPNGVAAKKFNGYKKALSEYEIDINVPERISIVGIDKFIFEICSSDFGSRNNVIAIPMDDLNCF